MRLNDEAIGQIAKILQVAILTGTDVVDNLRQVELTVLENELHLSEGYKEQFEKILGMIETGKREGAKLATGGSRAIEKGYFIQV